jgi:LysR family transcriptional regulator, transcriptional activator of the cysJI operon
MVFDFRLKVFYMVSQKLSFTKAAHELFITQPAVTKHIFELESQLKMPLFKRHGTTISLTQAGETLVKYAEQIFKVYASLENELAQLSNVLSGGLNIGASTTLAQYVLPKILALFKANHPTLNITVINGNSEFIEQQVISEKVDVAIVEGISHHPQIAYEPFVKDEIVLVAKTSSKLAQKGEVRVDQLTAMPLVLREAGSGTLDVVYKALEKSGINLKDLQTEIRLENTESIKQYLIYSNAAAFLSVHSISKELKNNELSIIDIKGIDIYRTFQFIQLHGKTSKPLELFKRFCLTQYNLK